MVSYRGVRRRATPQEVHAYPPSKREGDMRMGKRFAVVAGLALMLAAFGAPLAQGSTLDILWYTGGVTRGTTDTYRPAFDALAASSPGGNTWDITFWDSGPKPAGTFNTLVVTSQTGGWTTDPNYAALTASGLTEASFGNRVMVTGQDADWHYLNGPGNATTGQAFNGPKGFLSNAINWSGSGTGLGAVILDANAGFDLFTGLGTQGGDSNDVRIPKDFTGLPINTGLTTAGLSDWNTSAHDNWTGTDTAKWSQINVDGGTCSDSSPNPAEAKCTAFVTLIKAEEAGGGLTPGTPEVPAAVPEPSSLVLLGTGLAGFAARAWRKRGT